MREDRTIEKIYLRCDREGSFIGLEELDTGLIKTLLKIALNDFEYVSNSVKKLGKNDVGWNAVYKLHYDILHSLSEALVYFDKIKIKTHECLFTFLCEKHPELDFDWTFLEKIRTNRNGSLYYGRLLTHADWEEIELQTKLYIKTLKEAIEILLENS